MIDQKTRSRYETGYLLLAGVFIAALVAANLIFQKFFTIEIPLGGERTWVFSQSVGLLAYPVTFVVTDVLSEIYGRERANRVVTSGFVASVFVVLLIEVADAVPSASFGVGGQTFHEVFGLSKVAVFASMAAYLSAQYVDIRLYHFWRRVTKGKHLWLRNNASTITSQLLDTVVVLCLLAGFGAAGITWARVPDLIVNGLLFKWAFAAIDTPIVYASVAGLRRAFPELALRPDDE